MITIDYMQLLALGEKAKKNPFLKELQQKLEYFNRKPFKNSYKVSVWFDCIKEHIDFYNTQIEIVESESPESVAAEEKQNWKFLTASDLLNIKENKNFIIEKYCNRKEISMYFGASGHMKSYEMLYRACCIAKGKPYLDNFKTKKNNVAILSLENPDWIEKHRLRAILRGLNVRKPKNLYFLTRENYINLLDKEFQGFLKDFIRKNKIGLLLIDTINPAVPEIDDNAVKDVERVYSEFLKPFADEFNMHIQYLHHTNKQNKSHIGSMKWLAKPDSAFSIEKDKYNKPILTIRNEKGRLGEEDNLLISYEIDSDENKLPLKVKFHFLGQKGKNKLSTKTKMFPKDKAKWIITEALKENEKGLSNKELVDLIVKAKISKRTGNTAIKELETQEQILKNDKGEYLLKV